MKTELLAPAGSVEALHAALIAGADAVYIGGQRFGARAYASNPDEETLCEAIRLTHRLGKKLYMTVNTLQKDWELEKEFYDWMKPYVLEGLDGVIVQDFGVADYLHRAFPELPLHASTQMSVTGIHSARMLQQFGFERIVPARELSLAEVRQIYEETGIEIEAFAHGAMCYSYSGMCLMSSLIGGRSGNRGRCAGVCRLPFEVHRGEKNLTTAQKKYPLNLKDMNTIHILPDMIQAGVLSYKIEGRMKKPEYTAGVVSIYRKYLDLAEADPDGYAVDPADEQYLWELFNRDGFSEGCYNQRNGKELVALKNEKLSDVRSDSAKKITEQIRQELNTRESRRKLQAPVKGILVLKKESPLRLTVTWEDRITASVELGEAQTAQNQPVTEERIRTQINKTGNDNFYFMDLDVQMENDLFVPMQMVNELRRTVFQLLTEKIDAFYQRTELEKPVSLMLDRRNTDNKDNAGSREQKLRWWAEAETTEQLDEISRDFSLDGVYVSSSILRDPKAETSLNRLSEQGAMIRFALPHILRSDGVNTLQIALQNYLSHWGVHGIGFLARNLEEVGLLTEAGYLAETVLDASVYTMNSRAANFWRNVGCGGNTMSHELNAKEMLLRNNLNSDLVVYGRAPMMITAHCLQKTMDHCNHKNERLLLTDRKSAEFPVQCHCDTCYNVIYNALPLNLLGETKTIQTLGIDGCRISFTTENTKQVREVLRAVDGQFELMQNTTRGHFRRGVE